MRMGLPVAPGMQVMTIPRGVSIMPTPIMRGLWTLFRPQIPASVPVCKSYSGLLISGLFARVWIENA